MKQFSVNVDMRNRKSMIDFLENHFRYDTMNSWNCSSSYANNLKIHNLGLTHEQQERLYEIMECEGAYDSINLLIETFEEKHDWEWQAGFNGRSGGYLVLYQGGWKYSEFKSFCTECGQRNYTSVEETGCKCGRCGKDSRRDYEVRPKEFFTYPGKGVDMGEDFEDWTMDELRERVNLVTEFDSLCDCIVKEAAYMADNYTVETETYYVEKTRKVMSTK